MRAALDARHRPRGGTCTSVARSDCRICDIPVARVLMDARVCRPHLSPSPEQACSSSARPAQKPPCSRSPRNSNKSAERTWVQSRPRTFSITHMECGLSTAQGLAARGLRGAFGGGSASAVVDVCVATHMGGLGPHDRVCEMRSGAELWRRAWPVRRLLPVFSRVAPRVVSAGALSSPSR